MATQSISKTSEDEYLRFERAAERKSEFIDGQIFAMAGGSLPHSMLAANCILELGVKLRGGDCRVLTSDTRVRTSITGAYVYPDVSVVCGPPQLHNGASDILTNPTVIIEILSPSTADYDRGKKFSLYREIPSLQDYLMVHTDSPLVEHLSRQSDESWNFREYRGLEIAAPISSLRCAIHLADIYAGVLDLPV